MIIERSSMSRPMLDIACFVFLFCLFIAFYAAPTEACTTIIVGKEATADGSIIIARNEDNADASGVQNIVRHLPRKQAGLFRATDNDFSWPMYPNALGYTAFPKWQSQIQNNPSFEETGVNEYGVAISATETIFNSEAVLSVDPYVQGTGLTEDSIPSVILPYATSAREGIRLLGHIIETTGVSDEGFGVALSDRNEVWYLETASGHHWVAQRIPADSYFVSANQGRFQSVDFNDLMNVMSSPGFLDFLRQHDLYQPEQGPFNFFTCCISDGEHDRTYNYPRVRELMKLYSGIEYDREDGLYPVFVRPERKLTVQDVAQGLRNRYQGTAHDPYMHQNPKEPYRPISVMRASMSHITQTRPDMPLDIAVINYIALGMPDLGVYMPFYQGLVDLPSAYQGATGQIDDHSMFWRSRKMQALVLQDYPRLAPAAHQAIAEFEADLAAKQAVMDARYLTLWQKDKDAARMLIQDLTDQAVADLEQMLDGLIIRFAEELNLDLETLSNEQFFELIMDTEKKFHFHGA
ncbi:Dipeptidase [Desulfonatronum thiosulfatophilum]|uniref:Dipeptidase n=1 Tax=Desulfonatronum thiosulfatophilum TaxID=617002 RepID=A0A1G6EWD5_9BACT|nr:C69 family dipeptidase [Desulfonatronum thiosulfatophilum]SDB61733.1 Dipeptidase [Desulfonatronum thiosulfatophilum]